MLAPPTQFQLDRTVAVEFVEADAVAHRCAARGVTFAGLPGFNSSACGSRDLMTLPNPCAVRGDDYAQQLCSHFGSREVNRLAIAFVHPDLAPGRCRSLGVYATDMGVVVCETPDATVAVNPCLYPSQGWYTRIACHELAHANGWTADHAGGRYLAQPSFVKARLTVNDILPPEAVRVALLAKASKSDQ